ncbi:hypothetical protein [Microbacterium sp. LMI1-1-1.1]|uniref:hypothetical protein n=1 Tax=Microbacterium sp. LMI1-1-1.1 TaxID=3135223 RepID=UPI003465A7C8
MSTSDSSTPPLTRRQLRELRNTGATPVITPDMTPADAAPAEPSTPDETVIDAVPTAEDEGAAPASTDADSSASTDADSPASTDAGAGADGDGDALAEQPATDDAAPAAEGDTVAADRDDGVTTTPAGPSAPLARAAAPVSFAPPMTDAGLDLGVGGLDMGVGGLTRRQVRAQEKIRTASIPVITPDFDPAPATAVQPVVAERAETTPASAASETPAIFKPAVADDTDETPVAADAEAPRDDAPVAVVNPSLGSELLEGATPEVSLPPSFDQLIARSASATGSISTPNALILSQTPTGAPLVAPVTATGEVLITGTFDLPEGLGSIGHAPGTTDGRDADAVLIDGELPPASSPTPIAASAAISTVKQPGEIIRPPAPEKGSRLMIGLIITTGALAIAVVGALVLAFTTGVF